MPWTRHVKKITREVSSGIHLLRAPRLPGPSSMVKHKQMLLFMLKQRVQVPGGRSNDAEASPGLFSVCFRPCEGDLGVLQSQGECDVAARSCFDRALRVGRL